MQTVMQITKTNVSVWVHKHSHNIMFCSCLPCCTVHHSYSILKPMFKYDAQKLVSPVSSNIGGGSIATPGEVAGLWEAHQRFGRLPWSRLFEPSIALAENGITLNAYVAGLLSKHFHKFNTELK